MNRYFLLIFLMSISLFFNCEKNTIKTEPIDMKEFLPEPPNIRQVVAIVDEPSRGMLVNFYDNSDDETGFIVQRRKENGLFQEVANLSANSDEYIDLNLETYTNYTYRICAYNLHGNSEWSNEISQTTYDILTTPFFTYTYDDANIDERHPDSNYQDDNSLVISTVEFSTFGKSYILAKFDFSEIPSYAIGIDNASLRLCEAGAGTVTYPSNIHIYAVPIIDEWNANTVTWNNRPGSYLSLYGHAIHNPNNNACVEFDITEIVSDWFENNRPNYGLLIYASSGDYCFYYSKEGHRPGSALISLDFTW